MGKILCLKKTRCGIEENFQLTPMLADGLCDNSIICKTFVNFEKYSKNAAFQDNMFNYIIKIKCAVDLAIKFPTKSI